MQIRTIATLLSVLICPPLYGQETPDNSTENLPSISEKPVETIKVYPLKYLKSAAALALLQKVGPRATLAEDPRLNSIVARGNETDHGAILGLLESLDTSEKNLVVTRIIEAKSTELQATENIVKQIAEKSGVNLAFDKELGVILLKGPSQEVEWASEVIEKIGAVKEDSNSRKSQPTNAPQACALRLIWLSNDPSGEKVSLDENEAAIAESIKKLARLGFPNMRPKMQLMGRCDLIDGRAFCQVDGSNSVGNVQRSVYFKANVRRGAESSVIGEITINATAGGDVALLGKSEVEKGNASQTSKPTNNKIEVVVHLQPQKAYILSASPIGGFQSAFLVQFTDDF